MKVANTACDEFAFASGQFNSTCAPAMIAPTAPKSSVKHPFSEVMAPYHSGLSGNGLRR